MDSLVADYGLLGLFVSAFISSTIAPGGSEAALIYLLMEGGFSSFNLLIAATLGNTLGALTTWYLGFLTGKRYSPEKLISGKQEKALSRVREWGITALLFSWLPVIGDAFCFAAGWLKLSFMFSLILIAIGKLSRYGFIIYLFG
jgi:membrane protein YqaA with SNARE-associated domain